MAANLTGIEQLIARAKATLEARTQELAPFFVSEAPKWTISDRKIAMRYLIDCVRGGMDPKHWAQLHPAEWKRAHSDSAAQD